MKWFKNNLFRIFTIITILVLCIGCTLREIQNDTFYIIKLGEYIVNNAIDMMDHFSFINNLTYTYPHWLYDVFLYFIYDIWGYFGIYISNIVFFIGLIFSIYYISLKVIKNEFINSLNAIMSIFLLYGFVTARSQLVSMILFIWEVYFILRLIECGKKRYSIALIIICLLLANIHATIWPMYFILYLPFIFEKFINYLKNKFVNSKVKGIKLGLDGTIDKIIVSDISNFKLLIITMIISLFTGLLSPSKICYTYVFKVMLGSSQSYIVEHAPLVIYNNLYFIIMFLLLFVILIFTKAKIKLSDLCLIFGLGFMAISSTRHISLFFLIASLFIWKLCSEFIYISKDKSLDIIISLISNKFVFLILVFLIIICGYSKFMENKKYDFVSKEEYPVDVVKYIKDNIDVDNARIFNSYNFGSYLLFNDISVFIDSRSDLYMDEFNDLEYDIFDDYMNIVYCYEDKFEYYDIDYILQYVDSSLSLILYKDNNYKVVYEDKYFVLFERLD